MTDKDLHAGISELVKTAIKLGVTLEEAFTVLESIVEKLDVEIFHRAVSRSEKSDVPD